MPITHTLARFDEPPHFRSRFPGGPSAPPGAAPTTMQSSVTQEEFTWTFSEERPVGQYVNGDWFVVGPVTITNITPESTESDGRVKNGSMLDWVGLPQGMDSYNSAESGGSAAESPHANYSESLNVSPNRNGYLVGLNNVTVWSSIGRENPGNGRPTLEDCTVLTVVEDVPPEGAFRPNPYTSDKSHRWTESDLDWSILRNLSPPSGFTQDWTSQAFAMRRVAPEPAPNPGTGDRPYRHLRIEIIGGQGKDLSYSRAPRFLHLHLDGTQEDKRQLFINCVQHGLDVFYRAEQTSEMLFPPNGAWSAGRTLPACFAALALNDTPLKGIIGGGWDSHISSDNGQVMRVTQAQIDSDSQDFQQKDLNMPHWMIRARTEPFRSDNRRAWGEASYSYVRHVFWGAVTMAHLTPGMREVWDYEPMFDFVDRCAEIELGRGDVETGTNGIHPFALAMWQTYRTTFGETPFVWPNDAEEWY